MSLDNSIMSKIAKLGKVELSAEKIELSLMDDIRKFLKMSEDTQWGGVDKLKQAVGIFKEAQKKAAEAEKMALGAVASAKELGADQAEKEFKKQADLAKSMQANHKRWISTISGIK